MSTPVQQPTPSSITLPAIAALTVSACEAALLTEDGELKILPHGQAQMDIHKRPVMVCHAPYTQARLGQNTALVPFDVLELFAFVHPARFCVPTPAGLAQALGLSLPPSFEDYPFTLMECAQTLLSDLQREPPKEKGLSPLEAAKVMGLQGRGWVWTPYICAALGEEYDPAEPPIFKTALNIWKHLPEWSENAPPPPPSHHGVTKEEALERLATLRGTEAEERPQQQDYTAQIAPAFDPPLTEEPRLILAEAGTGVGKTLGYLAPATVWAEKNEAAVWISTYTKNLQHQIDREMERLYPDPALKDAKVTIRKGRENYLCLLNLEDTVAGAALAKSPQQAIAAGIMARWAEASRDGDMQGGDFPGWMVSMLGHRSTRALADRRGECIFSACDHYHKCFVERSVRKARHASIVIANHALVMIQTAMAQDSEELPRRYIFDEGHHLFDAADSAFAGHLTAQETAELRRWIMGAEGGKSSRARGLKRRLEDLIADDAEALKALEEIIHNARHLPALSWSRRLRDDAPQGSTETFLYAIYNQVHARNKGLHTPYSLETETYPLDEPVRAAARALHKDLYALEKPLKTIIRALQKRLNEQADTLDGDTRKRLESLALGLERRAKMSIKAWIDMLEALIAGAREERFIDWMAIERIDGRAVDVGLYRHYIDPMKPFADALKPQAHGMAITSATLRDGRNDGSWESAKTCTGAHHFTDTPQQFSLPSPFDYAQQSRIFIVNDVNKNSAEQVASAYRVLFEASGGGALGLFTAINRLRAVHGHIARTLEEKHMPLYAQHIDGIDTGTLVNIFRTDTHACLLGTDAVRDGVDVPGESLRLLVYDRVPWPRPTILHKARRNAFGGRAHDEMITRLKLRQAFGRLIRQNNDQGVFVILDGGLPSKLLTAFPEDVPIERIGLAETAEKIKDFL